jgi:hypothetical protein
MTGKKTAAKIESRRALIGITGAPGLIHARNEARWLIRRATFPASLERNWQ